MLILSGSHLFCNCSIVALYSFLPFLSTHPPKYLLLNFAKDYEHIKYNTKTPPNEK
nr:MAG TPA: hypothetical protein [Caudoviricetes sp.]